MKKLITAISAMILLNVLIYSQYNYNSAIKECINSNGSDGEITDIMLKHGFITDAISSREPENLEKLKALFINVNID
jgi:hypothetical protein